MLKTVRTGHSREFDLVTFLVLDHVRPGSDAVLHMSRIEFEFRPTQINLDGLN